MPRSWLVARVIGLLLFAGLLYGACSELYGVAWGTGRWFGEFSLRWGIIYLGFVLLSLLVWAGVALAQWNRPAVSRVLGQLIGVRAKIGRFRWLLIGLAALIPVWFLQYSPWGVVFGGPYARLLIWVAAALLGGFLLTSDALCALSWQSGLAAVLIAGSAFVFAVPFQGVATYPFALGWSEGNRLWDYSLLFGLHLYKYAPDAPPAAYLEPGRQLIGGLPFILSKVSIAGERLWLALLDVLPYLLLGLLAFRPRDGNRDSAWLLAGVWGAVFLTQGPIHAPLLICAIFVILAWGRSLWLGIPLMLLSGYYAEISRYTWIFAPAMWIVMLEAGSLQATTQGLSPTVWRRSASLGAAGLAGSLLLPKLLGLLGLGPAAAGSAPGVAAGGVSLGTIAGAATRQPLLWYRLLPNATFGSGILVAVLIAAGPLLAVLLFAIARLWRLNLLQRLAIGLPLVAFLLVGLVISTKIGGGGDLHNLDMFLIGLFLAAALAWTSISRGWIESLKGRDTWVRVALVLAVAVPAYGPLMALRPISFAEDADWLVTLTDVQRAKDLGSLPSQAVAEVELQQLREEVDKAKARGEVLFIDQRQLLTFGYLRDVQLEPEYEKKRMMDEALSGDASYFQAFYGDLASGRFSLIISDPLRTPIKDSEFGFGEENNAWVKWVARPVLCYYEEKDTLTSVRVELLVPRSEAPDCAGELP